MNRYFSLLGLFFLISTSLFAQQPHSAYIKRYSGIAVQEMNRTGIPASIKLAQGVLESGGGTSALSRKANNHFGIKCGSDWRGEKYYKKDDDRRNGRLVNSCFRKYKNPDESYRAHSEFLKKDRYKALFRLKPTDYKGWAKGLQKAGYATSNTYASKLIRLIEEYKLYQYDSGIKPPSNVDPVLPADDGPIVATLSNNGVKAIKWDGQQSLNQVAKSNGIPERALKRYNDIGRKTNLKKGQFLYLQPKRKRYRGTSKYHYVAQDQENMYDISQRYGVILDKLYEKNLMRPGQEPAKGARVSLKKKLKSRPKIRQANQSQKPTPPPSSKPATKPQSKPNKPPKQERPTNTRPDENKVHTVQSGETLYGISRKYNVSVDQIKAWNKLDSNLIKVGQPLIVGPK